MSYSRTSLLVILLLTIILTISCEPDAPDGECDPFYSCLETSFSFVDPETYENLMGYEGFPIHPDSISITNTRGDTMYHKITVSTDNWTSIDLFNPFQEITCFNQCLLDSAFTRTYYVHIGYDDLDTMEVYFPERSEFYTIYYNGVSGEIPYERRPGRSVFYAFKSL